MINTRKITGIISPNWKALSQGGEESGVRMLEKVTPQIFELSPQYIRIDHIYDFYNVVNRDAAGNLIFDFSRLDNTICDIYQTGAKPFFSLGYMPPSISSDGSVIGNPKKWDEWSLVVEKTIERYSSRTNYLPCQMPADDSTVDIYYEVWNEPDHEIFGHWSIYDGQKSYKNLYKYAALGAKEATGVNHFLLGGPAITSAYKNWFKLFLDYVSQNQLRLDFLSWHHYSKNPDDFSDDVQSINSWLEDVKYTPYRFVPKIISEWGYDSAPNPIADTNVGAAHTVSSIRNLIDQQVIFGFAFEVKDGPNPSWGILTRNGNKKPRYNALKLLNVIERNKLQVDGESNFIKAVSTVSPTKISAILVNYDPDNLHSELVPVTFENLTPGNYKITETYLSGKSINLTFNIPDTTLRKTILMPPNTVVAVELYRQ